MVSYEVQFDFSASGRCWIEADTPEQARQKIRAFTARTMRTPTTSKHMVESISSITVQSVRKQTDFSR